MRFTVNIASTLAVTAVAVLLPRQPSGPGPVLLVHAQGTIDPSCPAGTLVSASFVKPDGETCQLCSMIMETCGLTCSGDAVGTVTCTTSPDGCGVIVCPSDGPAPPTPTPTPTPAPTAVIVTPPPDAGTPNECGIEVLVGCILHDTADTSNPTQCNDYVPQSTAECTKLARYTYYARISAPPLNSIYQGAYRYRDGAHPGLGGNPVSFFDDLIGKTVTTTSGSAWSFNSWEAEPTNFCASSSSRNTTLQVSTNGGNSAISECRISDMYELVTNDVPFAATASIASEEDPIPATESFAGEEDPPAPVDGTDVVEFALSVTANDMSAGQDDMSDTPSAAPALQKNGFASFVSVAGAVLMLNIH